MFPTRAASALQRLKAIAHLYGRRMYEMMTAYWPTADEQPSAPPWEVEYAGIWKRVLKVVFSKTLERVDWNRGW
jgi:hypothetical protein